MYTTIYVYDFPSRSSKLSSRSFTSQVACPREIRSCCTPRNFRRHCIRHLESGEKWAMSPLAYVLFSLLCGFEGNEISVQVVCACMRIGRASKLQWSRHHTVQNTDQSRSVYLVRLISIWYCKWFMLPMTLDTPDEGTR
jgi:hypothetical protein